MNFEMINERFMVYGTLFSISNRIQTLGDARFKDITMKQHFMMIVLDMLGNSSPSLTEMGEIIGCSYQNVKRMAAALEKKGYLSIISDSADKRRLLLKSTGRFQQLAEANREATDEFMDMMYRGIPEENIKILLNTLMHMEQNLKKEELK